MKYYAIRKGRNTGIYDNWEECKANTAGYSGAVFKSFQTIEDAQQYLAEAAEEPQEINDKLPFAYIDGTYKKSSNIYGYGGYIFFNGEYHIIQGTGCNPLYVQERNVAGEVMGALQVLFRCLKLGIHEINLYYDYAGIEKWYTGEWLEDISAWPE